MLLVPPSHIAWTWPTRNWFATRRPQVAHAHPAHAHLCHSKIVLRALPVADWRLATKRALIMRKTNAGIGLPVYSTLSCILWQKAAQARCNCLCSGVMPRTAMENRCPMSDQVALGIPGCLGWRYGRRRDTARNRAMCLRREP